MTEPGLEELERALVAFRDARGWQEHHSVRNLTMALGSEVGELMAELRWLRDADANLPSDVLRARLEDEIADVTIFLVLLSERLGVPLVANALRKVEVNKKRFPI
jgi:dCTP diphosphatase